MKLSSINPNAMKGKIHQPNFYFSAYPLKALNLPEAEQQSYLQIYRSSDGYISRAGSSKVLPMINVYQKHFPKKAEAPKNTPPDNIEERESEWFANYE